MSSNYWNPWDKDDLEDEDESYTPRDDENPEEEHGCHCGYHCMDCLGMSWRDFM